MVTKYQDIIDSRDVIARIEELQEMRSEIEDRSDRSDPGTVEHTSALEDLEAFDRSEQHELEELVALADAADGASDWEYGASLIRDSYFKEYAQELAEECGLLPESDKWPTRCIDWDRAAEELKMDYFTVDFGGVTYWVRN
jgi:hypothetical protein